MRSLNPSKADVEVDTLVTERFMPLLVVSHDVAK
jgi:hypothetical protein